MKLVKTLLIHRLLRPRKERSVLVPIRSRALRRSERAELEPARLKLYAVSAVGALFSLHALDAVFRTERIKRTVRKELKKQLKPLEKQLDTMEQTLKELKKA